MNRQIEIAAARNIKEYEYWMEKLSGEPVKSSFPYDYPKSETGTAKRDVKTFRIEDDTLEKLEKLSKGSPHTRHIILLSVSIALLSKYTGHEDILVGTPIYRQPEDDNLINTLLVVRSRLQPGISVKELLIQVRQTVSEAVEHQAYPVELLPGKLGLSAPGAGFTDDFPLFDTALFLQEIHDRKYFRDIVPNLVFSFKICDGYIAGEVEYNASRCRGDTVERVARHFTRLLRCMLSDTAAAVPGIDILSEEERRQLVIEFNETAAGYPHDKTIIDLFEEQVRKKPGNTALVGTALDDWPDREPAGAVSLTYGQFDGMAERCAGHLREKGVGPGAVVAIMVERSIEMAAGIYGILKAGAAYLPMDPAYPQERVDYILADSGAKLVLTPGELASIPPFCKKVGPKTFDNKSFSGGISHEKRCGIRVNALRSSLFGGRFFKKAPPVPSCLAYIIYTSGSTGKPKGVMVRHRSVVNIIDALQRCYPLHEGDTYLFKTSYIFDVSVAELFGWFAAGGRLAVLDRGAEKEPKEIIDAVERYAVTHMNFVPSMFNVFVEELNPGNIGKCAGLKYIFLAGEALLPELVDKFRQFDTPIKLENIYGPTEGTVYTTNYSLPDRDDTGRIPIGKPMQNVQTYILGKEDRLLPIGVPGELCISGSGLAMGYLNNPELTSEKFIASGGPPFCKKVGPKTFHEGQGPEFGVGARRAVPGEVPSPTSNFQLPTYRLIYKTGDLCRWLPSGDIEFLGRIDQQVKIRGFRIELGEIENRLLQHERVKEAVVIAGDSGGAAGSSRSEEAAEKYLCAYIVVEGHNDSTGSRPDAGELREFLARKLPEYMIPSYFVPLDRIPLSPGGKVDRKALPDPGQMMLRKEYAAPTGEVEEKLVKIWSDVLGMADKGAPAVGIDDNFFELGGHSLNATRMIARVHREFQVQFVMSELYDTPTIRGIARFIEGLKKEGFTGIEAVEKKDDYTLSSAQRRLHLIHRGDPDGIGYNIPTVMMLYGKPDKEKFADIFRKLVHRHESFRTTFKIVDEEVRQQVHDAASIEFNIEYYEAGSRDQGLGICVGARRAVPSGHASGGPLFEKSGAKTFHDGQEPEFNVGARRAVPSIINSFIRPFDLTKAPLLRAGLITRDEENHVLMVDMHHIISDGTSLDVFLLEFMALYAGEELPRLKIHYKDYAEWQNSTEQEDKIEKQKEYWLEQFAGGVPVLELPYDYPRPRHKGTAGDRVIFEIGEEETAALNREALDAGTTLYTILLACYYTFLSKISGREDIVIGTPTAGRLLADVEPVIGMFVNTLGLRNYPEDDKRFSDFLEEVRLRTLTAFENQEYPFEELVENLGIQRDLSRSPLFDVMFSLQNMETAEIAVPGLELTTYDPENKTAKFDLLLLAFEVEDRLKFSLEYSTQLFKEDKIDRFIGYFKDVIAIVLRDRDIKLKDIHLSSNLIAPELEISGEIEGDFGF